MSSSQIVSKRIFRRVSEQRLCDLKTKAIKKSSFAKMKWGVKAYQDWRSNKIENLNEYNRDVFESNLYDLDNLAKENLIPALCKFIP